MRPGRVGEPATWKGLAACGIYSVLVFFFFLIKNANIFTLASHGLSLKIRDTRLKEACRNEISETMKIPISLQPRLLTSMPC